MKIKEYSSDIKKTDKEALKSFKEDCDKGFGLLEGIGAAVAIFGSARLKEDSVYYQKAVQMAQLLSHEGFHITSGGSYGIMEAANRGAFAGKNGESLGFNLFLPFEQETNPFTTKSITLENFAIRKNMLIRNAVACIAFPGGFGTLDELCDVTTLILTRKILPMKIYLYGSEFWTPLVEFVKTTLVKHKTIEADEADIWQISDDLEQINEGIKSYVAAYLELMRELGLEKSKRYNLIKEQFKNFTKEE
ncbi:MAG: TIGR00730 family Rossman fold protein [Campylobacteraceae bacterium]|nr:TIGR00730 family Rossman fold protein [Campylobacteraceae bacterium]